MKLLALSDLHGNYSYVESILDMSGDFDAVIIAGDITNFGPDEHAIELLKIFKEPVFAIPGNCDLPSILKVLDKNTINLHNSIHTTGGLTFIGLGGSNPTPFNTPFELSEKKIGEYVGTLLSKIKDNGRTILLSHAPPLNTTDKLPRGNVGSKALARFLGRLDLIICGHIHEARGSICVKGTYVVNPGAASKGHGALITIKDVISTEFIDA